MLLHHPPAQKGGDAPAGGEVAVHRPVEGPALPVPDPLLVHAGGKHRVLYVHKEDAPSLERTHDVPVHRLQVLHVVEHQVAHHQIVPLRRVVVGVQGADLIAHPWRGAAPPGLINHAHAGVQAQHLRRALLRRVPAVPSIAAPQIQHRAALHWREELPQLMPLPRPGQPRPAPGHAGVGAEKGLVVVDARHPYLPPPASSRAAFRSNRHRAERPESHRPQSRNQSSC